MDGAGSKGFRLENPNHRLRRVYPALFGAPGGSEGRSVEEYVVAGAHFLLETDENDAFVDPETGEVALNYWMFPDLEGCNVEQGAQLREGPVRVTRIPRPGRDRRRAVRVKGIEAL